MTPTPTTEATTYYSAKVHNTAAEPQKVKVYYESAHPAALSTAAPVEEAVVQPRSHHVFAPRTYNHAELGEQRYNVSKLELHPAAAAETTEVAESATVAPVVYETKNHHHHKKHKKHHGLFHRHHKHKHDSPATPVELERREDPVVLQIHEADGAYGLSPYDESAGTYYTTSQETVVQE